MKNKYKPIQVPESSRGLFWNTITFLYVVGEKNSILLFGSNTLITLLDSSINKYRGDHQMRQIAMLAGAILIMAMGYGCVSKTEKTHAGRIEITAENFEKICGMQWILKELTIGGKDLELTGEVPYITFEADGKIGGFASVNRFFGQLKIDSTGKLNLSPMGSTMMAGPENLMARERTFLAAFQKIDRLSLDGIFLHGGSEDKKDRLVFYVPVN